jgi:hypothetical protein
VTADLARVTAYRAAARRLLADEGLSDPSRRDALVRLMRRAKDEPDAVLAVGATIAEIGWSIDRADVLAEIGYGDPLERQHRALRAVGYSSCPTCLSRLSGEADWAHWRSLRESAIREAEAREGAVL